MGEDELSLKHLRYSQFSGPISIFRLEAGRFVPILALRFSANPHFFGPWKVLHREMFGLP